MQREPIAVVGVSALFPGSYDATGFWRDILAGKDLLSDIPKSHWLIDDYFDADPSAPDKTYAKRGGFLNPVDFDALGFGIPPSTMPATDTSQLLALIVAQQVLEDVARERIEQIDRSRISVILGVTSAQELLFSMVSRLQKPVWVKALRESGLAESEVQAACQRIADQYVPWQEASFPGLLGNVVAGRIANRLNLGGTNCVTDAACASSFSALAMAVSELQLGDSDLVITGGVDTLNDIFMYMCFSKTPALSPSGDCRPFDQSADGTMLGEGLGMIALKRLADAERDGDRIYGVLKGVGTSSDGRSKSVYAPVSAGQAKALRRAYEQAGYGPETVELVEAHGTGTKAGDAAEFEGLRSVYDETGRTDRQWCALGSVKSQIGHTKAAAGAAGLFKIVMALHHKVLPPTIKIAAPNPKLALAQSPFYLNTVARPWIRNTAHPRRASVSAFGFGGSNFHLTLEEYRGAQIAERLPMHDQELLALSAASPADLLTALKAATETNNLYRAARAARQAFNSAHQFRLALVLPVHGDWQQRCAKIAADIQAKPDQVFQLADGSSYGIGAAPGKLAFLFPGQGSQYVQMGADLLMTSDAARAVFDQVASIQDADLDRLHQLVFPMPVFDAESRAAQQEALTATEWAQPALAASSMAMLACLRELGVEANAAAGHSFGELSALCAAGCIDLPSLMQLARARGLAMAQAAAESEGGMLAVSATRERVTAVLQPAGINLSLANHNAPNQIVLSGALAEIARAETVLSQEGLASKRLAVATAFHSPIVANAATQFAEALAMQSFAPAQMPVYNNGLTTAVDGASDTWRELLANQIASPVRFVEMIEQMYADGVRVFVEVGASSVLTGLVPAILGDRPHVAIATDRRNKPGLGAYLGAVAKLAALGVPVQLNRLFADVRVDAPTIKPGKMPIKISGANYGKPYPPEDPSRLPGPNPERAPLPATAPVMTSSESPAIAHAAPLAPAHESAAMSSNQTPATPAVSAEWLRVFLETQQQTAQAHAAFQQAMADSHQAYLRVAETALQGISGLSGTASAGAVGAVPAAPMPTQPLPSLPPMPAIPAAAPLAAAPIAPMPSPIVPAPVVPAPVVAAAIAKSEQTAAPRVDLQRVLLNVVSEKTGYPYEMLKLDMDLEGDLGIDSIKRVEILAALEERAALSERPDRQRLSSMQTLAQIVSEFESLVGPAAPSIATVAASPAVIGAPIAAAPSQSGSARSTVLQVVADKTGYPVDMLQPGMDLEGDLGIDSIKRVEILAAIEERAPALAGADRARLSSMHTLAEIIAYLDELSPSAAASAPAPIAPTPTATPSAPVSHESPSKVLLQVVADKTGYPADMLHLDMDLEGDLGVDSIKRVEILAAFEERLPALAQVDRQQLSSLRTLREISALLPDGDRKPATASPSPSNAAAPSQAASPQPQPAATPKVTVADLSHTGFTIPNSLGRYTLTKVPAPATGMAMPGLFSGPIHVVGEPTVAEALTLLLRAVGIQATNSEPTPAAAGLIDLSGLLPISSVEQAMAIQATSFARARAIATHHAEQGGLFVTVQDTGGSFGLNSQSQGRAWLSGFPALVKTAALEWPRAHLRAIDLECGQRSIGEIAEAIALELLQGGGEIEVGLSAQGERSTLRSVLKPVRPSMSVLNTGDVVLVSGGARGVTAACIEAWARTQKLKFVLLGRTALSPEPASCAQATDETGVKRALLAEAMAARESITPSELNARVRQVLANREVRATIAAIQAAGAEAHYLPVDVNNGALLQQALHRVRTALGPITGLVHAAGVLADKRIADKTDAQFDAVFGTKVLGLASLLQATADDPLKLLAVFSSVSARCGNTGQADYAMANEVIAKVARAEARRRPGLRVKSFGWGPWEGGMVTPHLKARFAELGVPMIPLAIGAQMFVDELRDARVDDIELVLGGEPRPEALLSDGADARVAAVEVSVNQDSHRYLEGHAVDGQPVLPAVLVAEWFARAAASLRPGLKLQSLHDLKVLKGVRLDRFENGGQRFRVEARPLPDRQGTSFAMRLIDQQDQVRYSARVELGETAQRAGKGLPELQTEAWGGAPLYDELLFHRGSFELINAIDGVSDEGLLATLSGITAAGWQAEPWQLDVAALDAGLQAAVLMGHRMLGAPNLPMAIAELRHYGEHPAQGPLRAAAVRRKHGSSEMTTDIVLIDSQGRRIAELLGVQNVALPRGQWSDRAA